MLGDENLAANKNPSNISFKSHCILWLTYSPWIWYLVFSKTFLYFNSTSKLFPYTSSIFHWSRSRENYVSNKEYY